MELNIYTRVSWKRKTVNGADDSRVFNRDRFTASRHVNTA